MSDSILGIITFVDPDSGLEVSVEIDQDRGLTGDVDICYAGDRISIPPALTQVLIGLLNRTLP